MCTHPLLGIRTWDPATGGVKIKFFGTALSDPLQRDDNFVSIPCGQCMECRLANARSWTVRILHECVLHKCNAFITLTYDNEHIPVNGSLKKRDVQLFLKDLRRKLDYKYGVKIRYYCAGEYGSNTYRPHYHLIIFGWDFPDRIGHGRSKSGYKYYRSPLLESCWQNGFSSVGDVTYNSVAYVAKYVTKKLSGSIADFAYDGIDKEFATMSRRPGIGHDFVEQYTDDVYNYDVVEFKGFKMRPPVYYDNILSKIDPKRYCEVMEQRSIKGIDYKQKIHDRFFAGEDRFSWRQYERYLSDRELIAVSNVDKEKRLQSI